MSLNRRDAITSLGAVAGTLSLSSVKEIFSDKTEINVPSNTTLLFQGDSITDGGRNRGAYYANHPQGMGQGYVRHIVTDLLGQHPDKDLRCYNRGISGHRVFELRDRWDDDCLHLAPDVLSILIGVNDFWHTIDFGYNGTVKVYEDDFVALLEDTLKHLPDTKLIIGEPFVLHEGSAIKKDKWIGVFEGYQAASRRVSDRFGATFIPYQTIFDNALQSASTDYWCPDGVHPSMAGNYLMAHAWLDAFAKALK